MKGLTLHQPYATLVALREKRIDTRSWGTPYRGPVAIHAAKKFRHEHITACLQSPFREKLERAGCTNPYLLPFGAIVATAHIGACLACPLPPNVWRQNSASLEHAFGDFRLGRFALLLLDVRPLATPIPCRGERNLWDVPADVVAQIEEQRRAAA